MCHARRRDAHDVFCANRPCLETRQSNQCGSNSQSCVEARSHLDASRRIAACRWHCGRETHRDARARSTARHGFHSVWAFTRPAQQSATHSHAGRRQWTTHPKRCSLMRRYVSASRSSPVRDFQLAIVSEAISNRSEPVTSPFQIRASSGPVAGRPSRYEVAPLESNRPLARRK